MTDQTRVRERIAAVAADLGGTVGVAARNLASQASVTVGAEDLYPMASCFKIPVMVAVLRQVDAAPCDSTTASPSRKPTRARAAPSSTATRACSRRSAISST